MAAAVTMKKKLFEEEKWQVVSFNLKFVLQMSESKETSSSQEMIKQRTTWDEHEE